MLLNSRSNQFVFRLPKGFLFPEVTKKYEFYLKRLPTPFASVEDYLNHTIQSVTFPAIANDYVEQTLDKRPQYWRTSADFEKIIDKNITVTFKSVDGFLNYWVLFEQYAAYMHEQNMVDYHPDFYLHFLDRDGNQMCTLTLKQPILVSLDALEMSYASVGFDFRTFSATFKYNGFDIDVKLD